MSRDFPSQWGLDRMIGAGDSSEWSVRYFGGFPYLMRWIKHNDQPGLQRATINSKADYKLSIVQEDDKVLIASTTFTNQSINGASMPSIVEALLLRCEEGDKIECVTPWLLCDIAGNQNDCYVEIELLKIHVDENEPTINLLPMFSPAAAQSPQQNSGGGH